MTTTSAGDASPPPDPPTRAGSHPDPATLLEAYRQMLRIRCFEQRASELYRDSTIPGFLHLSVGQEATAVGVGMVLGDRDVITSTHRGHGHCLAKGMDMTAMFAELMGHETGTCKGRGGSMHIADPSQGVFGANGIVGAGLPIAVGAAFASRLRKDGGVVVAFFGDGATGQGYFHEAVNLAALWKLPVLFVCENNHYSEFSPEHLVQPVAPSQRALGYGIEAHRVDGSDVVAVMTLVSELADRARRGECPFLIEADTDRWRGHFEGDQQRYRADTDAERHATRDPIRRTRAELEALGLASSALDAVDVAVDAEIRSAVDAAQSAGQPDPSTLAEYVFAPRSTSNSPTGSSPVPPGPPAVDGTDRYRIMDAVHDAIEDALATDDRVFVAGIDVGDAGNVFGITRGLAERYGERVVDTPISESAIIGLAVGAAMAGLRPVVELMYLDFIGVCFDQLLNQAAKLRFMTGGGTELGLVVRTQFGAGRSSGSQHSQSLEALLAHIPGLTVVMPSNPSDAYGLLRASILDPNPVIFIENRLTYGFKGVRPPADHFVPLGHARIVRSGTHVTIVSISRMVHECVAAAENLAREGIDAEVIDLRTVVPLDRETVLESLARTSRLVIAHEAVTPFGIGAELAAIAVSEGFGFLDAPVARVGAEYTPAPYAPSLERAWLPDRETIAAAVRRTVAY